MQLILHIGAHKTGTTALQQYFTEHRAALAKAGILYPRSCAHHFAQHRLAFALRRKHVPGTNDVPDLKVEVRALQEEIARSSCGKAFISSEEFFSLPKENVAELRAALDGQEVRVLAVLRRPDELFASLYNQKVKETRNRFAQRHSALLSQLSRLSPDMCFDVALANWSSAFGADAVSAHCIEQYPNAIVLAARALGYEDTKGMGDGARRNVSVSVRTAEALRLGKQVGLEEPQLRRLRAAAVSVFGPSAEGESLLSPQERLQILREADPMTELIFKQFVRGENVYASRHFKESDFPPRTVLQGADLMKVIGALMSETAGP